MVPCWHIDSFILSTYGIKVPAKILTKIKTGTIIKRLFVNSFIKIKLLAIKLIKTALNSVEIINFAFIMLLRNLENKGLH